MARALASRRPCYANDLPQPQERPAIRGHCCGRQCIPSFGRGGLCYRLRLAQDTMTAMQQVGKTPDNYQGSVKEVAALYRSMLRIRWFEEEATQLFLKGETKGTAHSYIGQEVVAIGACAHRHRDDYIGSYHRPH